MGTTTTKHHYESLVNTYENGFFYQTATPYTEHLCQRVKSVLKPHGLLLDIGGGTGNFTRGEEIELLTRMTESDTL